MYHKNFTVSNIFTRGNHSFVRFGHHGGVEFSKATIFSIFEILKEFESEHPDWRITNWRTESYHVSSGWSSSHFVVGIWIDHEPRGVEKVSRQDIESPDAYPVSDLAYVLAQD